MSVTLRISQNDKMLGIFKPKQVEIDIKFLKDLCEEEGLSYGILNANGTFELFEESKIENIVLTIYDENKLGRGFGFKVVDNYNVELLINIPSTKEDIEHFYDFAKAICQKLNIKNITEENNKYKLEDIENLKEFALNFSADIIKDKLEAGMTIYGCINPINLPKDFVDQVRLLYKSAAFDLFSDYLHEQQSQNVFYATPFVYKNNNDGSLMVRYIIDSENNTIIPTKKYLPISYNKDITDNIKTWCFALIQINGDDAKVLGEIDFDEFINYQLAKGAKYYDYDHIYVNIDDKDIEYFKNK